MVHFSWLVQTIQVSMLASLLSVAGDSAPAGFTPLFNGKDLAGWTVPAGDGGHWRVVDGVIDYDAQSESSGDKNLWSEREYGDFVLTVDWRIKETPFINKQIPYILPDGSHARVSAMAICSRLNRPAARCEFLVLVRNDR